MTPNPENSIALSDEERDSLRAIAEKDDQDIAGMIDAAGADSTVFANFIEEMGCTADPDYIQIYSEMMAIENAEPVGVGVRVESVKLSSRAAPVRVYVGNLPFAANETLIRLIFERVGQVLHVSLINDRETGRPRGFGFVSMPAPDAQQAVAVLNGANFLGRPLKVQVAEEVARSSRQGELKNN
jgi:hypothetical protein